MAKERWFGSLLPRSPRGEQRGDDEHGHALQIRDLEEHYEALVNSRAFLYAFVDSKGTFLFMNRGMRSFLRSKKLTQKPVIPRTLLSCCSFGQMETLRDLLRDAREETVSALVPLLLSDGSQLWMDAEFSPMNLRGGEAIQIIGVDVTEWARLNPGHQKIGDRKIWSRVLDSCPGLLCCVLDRQGILLYASQGYRSLVSRVLGHTCEPGRHYPPLGTDPDRGLHGALTSAGLGKTSSVEIIEDRSKDSKDKDNGQGTEKGGRRVWNFTAAPLMLDEEDASGIVIRVLPVQETKPEPETESKLKTGQPGQDTDSMADASRLSKVRQDILDAFAGPAAVVNDQGICLAANAPLNMLVNPENRTDSVIGRRLLDIIPNDSPVNQEFHNRFPSVLQARGGSLECRLSAPDGELTWLEVRARPLEWAGFRAVMLTFNDTTRLRRTCGQLQRASFMDGTTGILNRQGMERVLTQRIERAFHDKTDLSLIVLDIDGFRRVNETRGYAAADRALKALTTAMEQVLSLPSNFTSGPDSALHGKETEPETEPELTRPNHGDVVGRWSGDEFMILTSRSAPEARTAANLLRDAARGMTFDTFETGNTLPLTSLTLSIGIARLNEEMDMAAFVAAAWDAMSSARRSGGDRVVMAGE